MSFIACAVSEAYVILVVDDLFAAKACFFTRKSLASISSNRMSLFWNVFPMLLTFETSGKSCLMLLSSRTISVYRSAVNLVSPLREGLVNKDSNKL